MGKLKEKLLNNLTPEEQNDMFELSAFEYVEYMENYKQQTEQIPDDVADQIYQEQIRLEREYFEQSELDEINDSIKLKYSDTDVIQAIKSVKNEEWFINRILKELNGIWNLKNGVE
jgi:hypothetical protein